MTANVLKFTPRKTKPVTYRASERIEITGLMIRGFGYSTDKVTGQSIYNATLTDFERNQPVDLPLVVQNVMAPERMETIDTLASGEAITVSGYLETTGGESYFVVEAVTQMRVRDQLKHATLLAYVKNFEDEAEDHQRVG
jgi:hypothetical protein